MSASDDLCLTCPKQKWIDFALESQGKEQPSSVEQKMRHAFSPAVGGDQDGRMNLTLLPKLSWLDLSVNPMETSHGNPCKHHSYADVVTVHQTSGLEYIAVLPGKKQS